MGKKVEYKNGFIGFASDKVAAALEKKGAAKILGPADAAPAQKREPKKIDRDGLMKKAIKDNLAEKTELLKMSDVELATLVGEE